MRQFAIGRFVFVGASVCGLAGAVVGLMIGLDVYPPTAWFAAFELGLPSTLGGALVGLVCAGAALAVRRTRH